MKTIEFELLFNDNVICKSDYVCIEDEERLYLHNISLKENIVIASGRTIELVGYINNKLGKKEFLFRYNSLLTNYLNCSKVKDCLIIDCEIDFTEPIYYDYNQELIDLFYTWNDESSLNSLKKKQWIYTYATLIYYGVPQSFPNDKTILLNGKKVESNYHLYNTIAESFLGNKGYIGSGLDSLYDSLRESKINKIDNRNIINILDFEFLEEKLNFYGQGYLNQVIEIFEEYGFKVNKM